MWIVSITSGYFADWILGKKKMSVTNVRKVFTTIGNSDDEKKISIHYIFHSDFSIGDACGWFNHRLIHRVRQNCGHCNVHSLCWAHGNFLSRNESQRPRLKSQPRRHLNGDCQWNRLHHWHHHSLFGRSYHQRC
jgi:hypothetical protein